jgi:hypothetical protein
MLELVGYASGIRTQRITEYQDIWLTGSLVIRDFPKTIEYTLWTTGSQSQEVYSLDIIYR